MGPPGPELARVVEVGRSLEAKGAEFEIIDVLDRPDAAEKERIITTPTLIRLAPTPQRRVVGNVEQIEKVLKRLDKKPQDADR